MGKKSQRAKKAAGKKKKKVDFHVLKDKLDDVLESRGKKRIQLTECPTNCPRFGEQWKCTFTNCIEIQKLIEYDEDVLKAFDIVTGKDEPIKVRDRGMRGNPRQRSRGFLRDEVYEPKIRDAERCYRIPNYDKDKNEIIPTCRTSIYGRRGKSETLIVMLETDHKLARHIHRHGKPLNVPMPNGKRRICLRNCKRCASERKAIFRVCKELQLREKCKGCETRLEAAAYTRDWFDVYCSNIGIEKDYLPYSAVRYVARPMTKSKGMKWI